MLVGFIIAVVFHEFMHGFVAYKFGDRTAKNAGRLTLDPIAHIDPIGTLLIPGMLLLMRMVGVPVVVFGYAKPVPINPFALRKRSAIIWVSLAGVLTNLLIAILFLVAARITYSAGTSGGYFTSETAYRIFFAFCYIAEINLVLFVFNLIPIPPLDGSRVLAYYLKGDARRIYHEIERYGLIIILLFITVFSSVIPILVGAVGNLILSVLGLPKIF